MSAPPSPTPEPAPDLSVGAASPDRRPARLERPKRVVSAALVWGCYALLDLIDGGFEHLQADPSGGLPSQEQVGFFTGALVVDSIVIALAFIMSARHNWARIVLCLVGAVRIAIGLAALITADSFSLQLAVLVLMPAAAIIHMFAPSANAWFGSETPRPKLRQRLCTHCGVSLHAASHSCHVCGAPVNKAISSGPEASSIEAERAAAENEIKLDRAVEWIRLNYSREPTDQDEVELVARTFFGL